MPNKISRWIICGAGYFDNLASMVSPLRSIVEIHPVDDGFNQPGPALPPFRGGTAPAKSKGDIVVVDLVADVGLYHGQVVAQANAKVHVVLGKNHITLVPVWVGALGHLLLAFDKNRTEALSPGRLALGPAHGGEPPPKGFERNGSNLLWPDLALPAPLQSAAEVQNPDFKRQA